MASVFRCCPKLPGHLQRESRTRVRALDGGGDVTEHPPSQEVLCQQETKKKVDSLSLLEQQVVLSATDTLGMPVLNKTGCCREQHLSFPAVNLGENTPRWRTWVLVPRTVLQLI